MGVYLAAHPSRIGFFSRPHLNGPKRVAADQKDVTEFAGMDLGYEVTIKQQTSSTTPDAKPEALWITHVLLDLSAPKAEVISRSKA